MRHTPGEDYNTWVQKARQSELERSYRQLYTEPDIDKILVSMSDRLTEKLLYPLIKQIQTEYFNSFTGDDHVEE